MCKPRHKRYESWWSKDLPPAHLIEEGLDDHEDQELCTVADG